MNIKGKLIEKWDTQTVRDGFRKREFVIEFAENPQYPELLKFELIQSNCEQLDTIEIGDEVGVTFNLKGRKWTDPQGNDKYFTSLQAWRLDKASGNDGINQEPPAEEWISQSQDFSGDDDLPF